MRRREFIRQSALVSGAVMLGPIPAYRGNRLLPAVGVQLFSLPKLLDQDFTAGLALLKQIGFKEVELYGPFPFSTEAAWKRWNAVTPSLGFKGSGFFRQPIKKVASLMKDHGLQVRSLHTDIDTLQHAMPQLAAAAKTLGAEYVVLPAIPDELRKTLDDYKRIAETFNAIGKAANHEGVHFAYHNHGYGIVPVNGQVPLKLILDGTDPDAVFFEMDLYWTIAGGADPLQYLDAYASRYKMMHVKDMAKKVHFSGDGGDAKQWIELFPYMTTAGSGIIDLPAILTKAKASGVQHFFVEQDMVDHPETALKKSFDYLSTL